MARNKVRILTLPADEEKRGFNIVAAIEFLEGFDAVIAEELNLETDTPDYLCLILVKNRDKNVLQMVKDKLGEFGIKVEKEFHPQLNPEIFPQEYFDVTVLTVYECHPKVTLPFAGSYASIDVFFHFGLLKRIPYDMFFAAGQ